MSDLAQALRDEAELMRMPLFGRTLFDPPRIFADMFERIARRLEGEDVTAEWLAIWEPYYAEQDAKWQAELEAKHNVKRGWFR